MSKGYTITYFIQELQSKCALKENKWMIIFKLCPKYSIYSAKFKALDKWLDGKFYEIADGNGKYAGYGKHPRTRIIKALQLRKKHKELWGKN